MDIKGKTLLLVGGAGLVGSHITDLLVKEEVKEIRILDDFRRGTRENLYQASLDPRVKIIEGNILDMQILKEACEGVDGTFLLAALWLLQCAEDPRSALEVNVIGNFNVVEACKNAGVKRLVYSSSASVYGNALVEPMPESHELNNRTFYGATKVALEQMLRSFNEMYKTEYVALRYFNIYGPRQDYKNAYVSVIMKVLDKIDSNEPPIIMGDGSQSYDFIYVKDIARANILAMKSSVTDESFNICTGKKTSINQLVQMLLALTHSSVEPERKPAGAVFVTDRVGDPSKAERLLGFKPETTLIEGLKELIQWRQEKIRQDTSR